MSPSQDSKSRADEIRRRREEEQKRRDLTTQRKRPVEKKPVSKTAPAKIGTPRNRFSNRYDIAMSSPNYSRSNKQQKKPTWQIQAPSLPSFGYGPRWISFLVVLSCAACLYMLATAETFIVRSIQVQGNNRISTDEIISLLGAAIGDPSALINPLQMEYNVLAAYPDVEGISVLVELPAQVTVIVAERQPTIAWQQNNQIVWVDAKGFSFPPRGFVDGLVNVTADGAPIALPTTDLTQTMGARPFLTIELAQAISILAPYVPQGTSLIYDPEYGLGWNDPRGWQAFFGQTNGAVTTKLQVYQSMVDALVKKGIQASLISVEYPNAPFYREK